MSKGSLRRMQHEEMRAIIEITNNEDELIDLLADANSMAMLSKNDLAYRNAEVHLIKTKLKKVRENATKISVTDHAVVRYLERVTGLDIEACKAEILSKIPEDFDWSDSRVEYLKLDVDGLQYVMRDRLIITVCPVTPKKKVGATA